jgi:hypothetical protein
MAALTPLSLSKKQLKDDLREFEALLNDPNKPNLDEKRDILPFFDAHPHLCAFIGRYNPNISNYRSIGLAREFDVFGDHVADLVIGDTIRHAYTFIEFEDAKATSIFRKTRKSTPEWSTRFEHGFSQLVDWILWLESHRKTPAFKTRFKTDTIQYNVLLIIGRDKYLDPAMKERLNWRNEHVSIYGKQCHCITFDGLYRDLTSWSKGIA